MDHYVSLVFDVSVCDAWAMCVRSLCDGPALCAMYVGMCVRCICDAYTTHVRCMCVCAMCARYMWRRMCDVCSDVCSNVYAMYAEIRVRRVCDVCTMRILECMVGDGLGCDGYGGVDREL